MQVALDEDQQEIIQHHAGTGCRFLVITDGRRNCLVVSKRRKKQGGRITGVRSLRSCMLVIQIYCGGISSG